jgi:hypothetical protein
VLLKRIFPRSASREICGGAWVAVCCGSRVKVSVGKTGSGVTLGDKFNDPVGGGLVGAACVGRAVAVAVAFSLGGGAA